MLLDTLIYDPTPCGFPKPRVPLLPVGLDGIGLGAGKPWAPTAHFRHFTRGRYALRETYRLAGIEPGSALLAPAYHCRTMLDPALALGGDVRLYPLQADLSPDLAALDALAESASTPAKVLLVTHFFGIPQSAGTLDTLADWCRPRGIVLVEDASHAFLTETHRPPGIGRHGDFVTSSPYKFLPSADGGLLYARDASALQDLRPRSPTLRHELRGLAHLVAKSRQYHRPASPDFSAAALDRDLAAIARTPIAEGCFEKIQAGLSADYRHEEEGFAALRSSRWTARHADAIENTRRRANYRRWADATRGLAHCRPLHPELPEGSIPYMFPLVLSYPAPHFATLKRLGVPIYRWDSLVASACPVANDYRLRLLHLPCHQSLTSDQLNWMIASVQKVGAGGTAH